MIPNRLRRGLANLRRWVAQKLDLRPDGILHLWRNDLRAAYEHTHQVRGSRLNRDGKHNIRRLPRQNIEHARTFFKPTVAQGLTHRRRLLFIETRTNQLLLQVLQQWIDIVIKLRSLVSRLASEVVNQLISNLTAAILEKDYMSNPVLARISQDDTFAGELDRQLVIKISHATIKQKLFLLNALPIGVADLD